MAIQKRLSKYPVPDFIWDEYHPDTLSQLIRTAFVPRPGYKFIVSDFSAIEARVLAYLAGETCVPRYLQKEKISTVPLPARCSAYR